MSVNKDELIESLMPKVVSDIDKIVHHSHLIEPDNKRLWALAAIRRNPFYLKVDAYSNPSHSNYIPPDQIERQILNHISGFLLPRMNRITGTDSARTTAHMTGVSPGFGGDMSSVVKEKLMITPPLWIDGHIMRGLDMEDKARDLLIEKGYEIRKDLLENIKENASGHAYLGGNPDEIVQKRVSGLVRTYVADYKAPSKSGNGDFTSHDYVCQAHHYAILSQIPGKNPITDLDGMFIANINYSTWQINEAPISWDRDLANYILDAAEEAHQYVRSGIVPTLEPLKQYYDMGHQVEEDTFLKETLLKIDQIRSMESVIQQEKNELEGSLGEHLRNSYGIDGAQIRFGGLNVTTKLKPTLGKEELIEFAETEEVDVSGLTPAKMYSKLSKSLDEKGVDIIDSIPHQIEANIATGRTQDSKEHRAKMETILKRWIPIIEKPDIENVTKSVLDSTMPNSDETRSHRESELKLMSQSVEKTWSDSAGLSNQVNSNGERRPGLGRS